MMKKYAGLSILLGLVLVLCSCAPVTINSSPEDAEVYDASGQTRLGATPFNTAVAYSDRQYIIRKEGYFDQAVLLNYKTEKKVNVSLQSVPVELTSEPVAKIYQSDNDTPIGQTPAKIPVLSSSRTYTLKADGYYDREISISADTVNPLAITLDRRPIVTLSAKPAGAEIYENGKKVGTGSITEEILNPRTFELRKDGYFSKTVTLKGAPPYEVSAELKAFPVITVSATPATAQILRSGKTIGTGSAKLSVGEKINLEVKADRFYAEKVSLTPDSPAQVSVNLKAMPYVTVASRPAGAQVYSGSKLLGTAPVELLVEKPVTVELRKDGFISKTSTLSGSDATVAVALEAVPVEEPAVSNEAVAAETPAVPEPAAAVETAEGGMSPVVIGGIVAAVAVIAGIIFGILRKKK
jgi:hypothetical protein